MKKYNYKPKLPPFFEGWYFRHYNKEHTLCIIAGRNVDSSGAGASFVQIIYDGKSYNINYRLDEFLYLNTRLAIKLEKNYFTEKGIVLNIDTDQIKIKGKVTYKDITPLNYSFMGPLSFVKNAECRHEIVSLTHSLSGVFKINGENICFDNGRGYIEGDSGRSFPQKYNWISTNDFVDCDASVVAAVATVKIFKYNFQGCSCVILYNGKQYRLATYKGAEIKVNEKNKIVIQQGDYKLCVNIYNKSGQELLAPSNGNMSRKIKESTDVKATFRFYKESEIIFSMKSDRCCHEFEDKNT